MLVETSSFNFIGFLSVGFSKTLKRLNKSHNNREYNILNKNYKCDPYCMFCVIFPNEKSERNCKYYRKTQHKEKF